MLENCTDLWCRFVLVSGVALALSLAGAVPARCAASANASGNSAPRTETPSPGPSEESATELAARFFDPLLAEAQTDTVRATLLHQRGVLYLRSHHKQKAIDDFNQALRILPEKHEERFELLFHRACAYLLLPKPDARAAIQDIAVCLQSEPNDPEALIMRANAYRHLGKKELANADISRAAALAPKSDTAMRALLQNARDAAR